MGSELLAGFACGVCGRRHAALPLSYSVKVPLAVKAIPESELEQRVVFTPDQCVVDRKNFYLRGRILVPVIGLEEPFVWGVWTKISLRDFLHTDEVWKIAGRENEPPFPGWLDTDLFVFGSTAGLEVSIQTQMVGQRPHFTVADPNHPLAIEQRTGITLRRVEEIAETMLHELDRTILNRA